MEGGMDAAAQAYFAELASLLDSVADPQEKEAICASALDEAVTGNHAFDLISDPKGCVTLQAVLDSPSSTPDAALAILASCLKSSAARASTPASSTGKQAQGQGAAGAGGGGRDRNGRGKWEQGGHGQGQGYGQGYGYGHGQQQGNGTQGEREEPSAFSEFCTMPGPSRIIETCLRVMRRKADASDLKFRKQLLSAMKKLSGAIRRSLLHIMSSPCGSHVLRHLLSFLLLGQPESQSQSQSQSQSHPGREGGAGAPEGNRSQGYQSQGQPNPGLTSLLEEVNGIAKTWPSIRSPMGDLFKPRQASAETPTQAGAHSTDPSTTPQISTVSGRVDESAGSNSGQWDIPELASLARELAVDLVKAGSSKAAGGTVSDSGDQCLCCSAVASPTMQAALQAVTTDSALLLELILHILLPSHLRRQLPGAHQAERGGSSAPLDLAKVWKSVNVDKMVVLTKDRVGSRFVEAVLRIAPPDLVEKMVDSVFQQRMGALAQDPSANFVVQALLQVAPSKHVVKKAFVELEGCLLDLLRGGRGGVVAALMLACRRLQCFQAQASTAVLDAARSLDIPEPDTEAASAPAGGWHSHDKGRGQGQGSRGKEKGPQEGRPGPVWSLMWLSGADRSSLVGCLIVQALVSFPQKHRGAVIEELSRWSPRQLASAAHDSKCSRVLDFALSAPSIPESCKRNILAGLRGRYAELARSPVGIHVVDHAYDVAAAIRDMDHQEAIVTEVAKAWSHLQRGPAGLCLSEKLQLAEFRRDPHRWKEHESKKEELLAEFSDFLGTTDTTVAGKAPTKKQGEESKGKKRKKSQPQTEELEKSIDADESKPSDNSHDRKKEKKKKQESSQRG